LTVSKVQQQERGGIKDAMRILGTGMRTVEDMAAAGLLPGAAKFNRRWSFDLEKLRQYVEDKEREIANAPTKSTKRVFLER
jgi:hypothetical protein